MSNLLLISDVPRLGKVFSRLADELNMRLRVATSLEKGAEEILADKPAIIFVQTHLSGFSADILLKHLKKQLGRRRSHFVLLSPPEQISDDVRKLYHDQIDSSLDDQPLYDTLRLLLDTRSPKGKKAAADLAVAVAAAPPADSVQPADGDSAEAAGSTVLETILPAAAEPGVAVAPALVAGGAEPTLEEQGVVYSPRHQLSVYSEFTNSFDNAVNSMPATDPLEESHATHSAAWHDEYPETIDAEPVQSRSKKVAILLWSTALIVVVVGITALQHRSTQPKKVELAPATSSPVVKPVAPAGTPVAVGTATAPLTSAAPAAKPPVAEPDARLSDKAVLNAIAENRGGTSSPPGATRLKTLPDFIPRTGADKSYTAANPGWERYKGRVTEFKVYREGEFIKAIQVIDRGGQGVPDSFMKGVLRQLTKSPSFVTASSEKKEGYEIQRGQIAENLKVVYYRDAVGGKLRAFVVTWQ